MTAMRSILVTGSEGQLGLTLKKIASAWDQYGFTYVDIHELDLTNEQKVKAYFHSNHFDYIVNCAAYTAVDMAEKQPESAYSVNKGIPELLGSICMNGTTRLIHFSTDYVYNGKHFQPHREDDITNPVSVYANSKLDGERALWENPNAMIIRTSWLYSEFGNNFLKTMIRLMKDKNIIGVVYDQVGTPTYTGDLAATVLHIINHSENNSFRAGIYNYANEGVCSWFDFAVEIRNLTGSNCKINPLRTEEYPLPASRPAYGVMDKSKIKRTFELNIPHWRESLIKAEQNLRLNTF